MEQMQMRAVVTGAKKSKGEMEGRSYDSTKVYIQMGMDTSQGTAVGMAGAEYNWGTSVNYDKIAHLDFPFTAILKIDTVTNGKSMKQICVDVIPEKASKQAN